MRTLVVFICGLALTLGNITAARGTPAPEEKTTLVGKTNGAGKPTAAGNPAEARKPKETGKPTESSKAPQAGKPAGASKPGATDVAPGNSTTQSNVPQRAVSVLNEVKATGRAPRGFVGGRTFQNREARLPSAGHYKEYDVNPKSSGVSRGAQRIVVDRDSGRAWYTSDHYKTFIEIKPNETHHKD